MYKLVYVVVLVFFFSCQKDTKKSPTDAVARVEDAYLYVKDITDILPENTSKEDSLVFTTNFINRWALKQLLKTTAENNISDKLKVELDQLVEQYRADLYTNEYIERIISRSIDTVVSEEKMKQLYDETKNDFRLNSKLLKLRFVVLSNDHPKYELVKSKFQTFTKKDKEYLESIGIQFKQYALNNDVWVSSNSLFKKFPFLTPANVNDYIVQGKMITEKEDKETYLIKINEVLDRGAIGPYEYQKPTLKDILLNQQKLKLIQQFEKDITENALKDEKFEIFK